MPLRTVPTLAELRESSPWFWLYCEKCGHRAAVAFVPLMIRWGADASATSYGEAPSAQRAVTEARRCSIRVGSVATLGFSHSPLYMNIPDTSALDNPCNRMAHAQDHGCESKLGSVYKSLLH